MNKQLIRIFPVQSKSYSGFFRISRNTIPYALVLTKDSLSLKFFGIFPVIKINISNIINFRDSGSEWVATTRIFNGVIIKYKIGDKTKERIIGFYNKEKSAIFLDALSELVNNKEI